MKHKPLLLSFAVLASCELILILLFIVAVLTGCTATRPEQAPSRTSLQAEYERLNEEAEIAAREPELESRYYRVQIPEHTADGVLIDAHPRFIEIVE